MLFQYRLRLGAVEVEVRSGWRVSVAVEVGMVLELSLGVGDGVNEAVKVALEEAAEDRRMKQASHGRKWFCQNAPR